MMNLITNYNDIQVAFNKLSYDDFVEILNCDFILYKYNNGKQCYIYDLNNDELFDFLVFVGKGIVKDFSRFPRSDGSFQLEVLLI